MTRHGMMGAALSTACVCFVIGGFAKDFGYQNGGNMLLLVGAISLLLAFGGAAAGAEAEEKRLAAEQPTGEPHE